MRNSDRWVTPGVVMVGLLTVAVVVLGITAAIAWLAARGVDPQPVLQLVGVIVTAVSSVSAFVLQLVNRRSVAKVERNTGVQVGALQEQSAHLGELTDGVYHLAEQLPRVAAPPPPAHAYGSAYDDTVLRRSAAPAPPPGREPA